MKSVSTAYKNSMKKLFRNASDVRIVLQLIDTEAVADGAWTDTGHMDYSRMETVDRETANNQSVATLELNRWSLDGALKINGAAVVEDGFVSTQLSNADGAFSAVPSLTKEFTVVHSLSGMTFYFDKVEEEWPVSMTAQFYLADELVDTVEITDIADSLYTFWYKVDSYDKVVLTPGNTLPHRRFRLTTFLFGATEIFGNADVISTQQSNDVDPLSRRLPAEKFSFTIIDFDHKYDPDNPEGFYAQVEENCPVSIAFGYELDDGTTEWVKPDRYLLNARPTVQNERVTFEATGLLGTLNSSFYKSMPGSKNLYDMAEEILSEADLGLTVYGTTPWQIDSGLRNMTTTGILPIDSCRNNLQRIAHAACCRLYTDDDNIIHITPFANTVIGLYKGTASDNGHTPYSELGSVETGQNQTATYATLELNRWELADDSPQFICPEDGSEYATTGYVSSQLAGAGGAFSSAPIFTRRFSKPCNCSSIQVRFDALLGEWPRSITVRYYNGNTLLATETVEDISDVEATVVCDEARECDRITITGVTTAPYRRMRLTRVYYYASDFFLDFNTIAEKTQTVTKIDKLKSVSVRQYSYKASGDSTTLYEEETDETELHVEFSSPAQNISITVTGGTLLSSQVYGRAADLTLSAGTKTVRITGHVLDETNVIHTTAISAAGEEDMEENPLITSNKLRNALMTQASSYLQMRNTYDVEYRGNPELETGDVIGMQTRYTDNLPVLILTDEITYNGALHGKLKVKGLI